MNPRQIVLFDLTVAKPVERMAILNGAKNYALAGGQSLLLHPSAWCVTAGPSCFRGQGVIGKLMDQDVDRLTATARRLGVRRIVVDRPGQPEQHVDLCGAPLRRAMEAA